MATSSTRIFDHFEAEYLSSTKTAAQTLERLADLIPGAEKDREVQVTTKALDSAEDVVEQMQLEARSTQGETKAQLVSQVFSARGGLCTHYSHSLFRNLRQRTTKRASLF